MGCLKLTYNLETQPLKVVYRADKAEQKIVQRFLSVDPLAEKYPPLSAYSYVANTPINAIDPDGKRIYFVNANGELGRATRALARTVLGKALYMKYFRSNKDDVYIAVSNFGSNSAAAALTVPNAQSENKYGVSVGDDNKIAIDKRVDSETKAAFSAFDEVDFSQSEGKAIHLVSISEEALKANDEYTNAETIFHEIKAHIDINTGDVDEDHKAYGKSRSGLYTERVLTDPLGNVIPDDKGNLLKEVVPPNSPAGQIVKELTDLKASDAKTEN